MRSYDVPGKSFEEIAYAMHAYMTSKDDPDATTFHQLTEKEACLVILGLRLVTVNTDKVPIIERAQLLEEKLLDAARLQRGGGAAL